MSESAVPPIRPETAASAPAAGVWKPVLFRGAVAGIFGLATVFWQQPTELGASVATAAFLVATAGTVLWLRSALPFGIRGFRASLATECALLAAAGLLVLVFHGPVAYGITAGLGLVAVGAVQLAGGWRDRRAYAPGNSGQGNSWQGISGQGNSEVGNGAPAKGGLGKDWVTTGAVTLAAGLILPLFIPLGTKALLGVVGGAAIILAVLLLLAGLSYRHDDLQGSAEAVN